MVILRFLPITFITAVYPTHLKGGKNNRYHASYGFGMDLSSDRHLATSSLKREFSIPMYEQDPGYGSKSFKTYDVPTYAPTVVCPALCQVQSDCLQFGYSHCFDNCCRMSSINSSKSEKPTSYQVNPSGMIRHCPVFRLRSSRYHRIGSTFST
jgi:hypothetical protein